MGHFFPVGLIVPVVLCNVIASLLLKFGAGKPPSAQLAGFMSWWALAGLCVFGVAGLLYAYALRHIPLSIAQALASLQYVLTVIAAVVFFGESLSLMQIFGMICIGIGIACVIR